MLKSEIRESKSERIPKSGVRSGKPSEFGFRTSGFGIACCSCSFVVKNKNPTAVWRWGSINLVNESEPDRRAAQQQRVRQQIQIQIAIHVVKIAVWIRPVKSFSSFQIAVFRRSTPHSLLKLNST